jgi:hypothetical protein
MTHRPASAARTALLALACATFAPAVQAQPAPTAPPAAAAPAPGTPALVRLAPPGDGFAVQFPAGAQAQRNQVTIPAGQVSTAAWSMNVSGVLYSISFADYPEAVVSRSTPARMLDEGRDGLVTQLKGTLEEEAELGLGSHPGRAFRVSSTRGELRGRLALVGRRLYTLITLYNPSVGAPAASTFLASLELTGTPSSPTVAAPGKPQP